jgi:hypothetical protein
MLPWVVGCLWAHSPDEFDLYDLSYIQPSLSIGSPRGYARTFVARFDRYTFQPSKKSDLGVFGPAMRA